ncbi:MAG: hypothetical protein R3D26_09475 [Cyanobacteriota/Melainabacteria group bacterium]
MSALLHQVEINIMIPRLQAGTFFMVQLFITASSLFCNQKSLLSHVLGSKFREHQLHTELFDASWES